MGFLEPNWQKKMRRLLRVLLVVIFYIYIFLSFFFFYCYMYGSHYSLSRQHNMLLAYRCVHLCFLFFYFILNPIHPINSRTMVSFFVKADSYKYIKSRFCYLFLTMVHTYKSLWWLKFINLKEKFSMLLPQDFFNFFFFEILQNLAVKECL